MQGKTHENIKTIRPLKDGVIADFDASEKMIFYKKHPCFEKKNVYSSSKDGGLYSFWNYRS
jgi:rod shape-determining protein MreB